MVHGVPVGAPLISIPTTAKLVMDGIVEPAWQAAPALYAPLHRGLHGTEPAGTIELRSLHDGESIYFLAVWPCSALDGDPHVWSNLLTVHWKLSDLATTPDCTVACHTATADGAGRLVGMRLETIPTGLDVDLPAGGECSEGLWTVEWSRPLTGDNPFDQPMTDLGASYPFFVKWFQGVANQADPTTDVHELRFTR